MTETPAARTPIHYSANFGIGASVLRCMGFTFSLAVCAIAAAQSAAQSRHDMSHHHAGPVPQEILERPVTLRSGIGRMHQKVSTSSSAAQAFYDQGLAYLHSYVWIEAARSFRQALRLDPNLAMSYVEMADAYIGLEDVAAARAACERAQAYQGHMTDSERAWLLIRQRELGSLEDSGNRDKYVAYQQSIEIAIKANPRDPWLWVQRGLATEASPFTHGQASGTNTLSPYKTALSLDPQNLAALHYSIHADENLGRIREALDESATYARLAPAIPHAHHMHGHELMRMGRTDEAIQEFLIANRLEESYYRTEKIPAQFDWHHAHNLLLLALNYELLGKIRDAEALFRQAFALPASTEFLAYNRKAWPEFLIDRGRFDEALSASRELAESQWPMARLAGHTLAGAALLGLNRLNDAQQELALAQREAEQLPAHTVAALPYPAALQGAILVRQNRAQEGEQIIVKVQESLVAMPGPDAWIASVFALESIARDAREAGDWDLARFTAEKMIQQDPYYAGGHFALGLVAEHAGETAGARPMFAQAGKLWSQGDRSLPELVLTRKKLAEIR
jgi:tetratricopeptide (TPR) repeat protein